MKNKQMAAGIFLALVLQLGGCSYTEAFALPDADGTKAKAFHDIFLNVGKSYEVIIPLPDDRTVPRKFQQSIAEEKLAAPLSFLYQSQALAANLGLDPERFAITGKDISLKKTAETVLEKDEQGKKVRDIRFVFQEGKINSDGFNPFLEKKTEIKLPKIKKFERTENGWEIIAIGYGYAESDETIAVKSVAARKLACKAVYDLITRTAIEKGAINKAEQTIFRQELEEKVHKGGSYRPSGYGVYYTKLVRLQLDSMGQIQNTYSAENEPEKKD